MILSYSFPDSEVRETATNLINQMSDDDLCRVLPQLTQALRHNTYQASPLAGSYHQLNMSMQSTN